MNFIKLWVFLGFIVWVSVAESASRTALVIGNSDYPLMPLANPENDAEDIADKLKQLDFEVLLAINKEKSEIKELIREFGIKLRQKGGVGLFFYAGHGLQIDGKNYLVPVDFSATAAYEVADQAVDASLITGAMEEAENPMNIILLDACRDNPFPRKNRSGTRGLARMDSASGTIIAYSTSPGDVAADGEGRNSPYTAQLLKYMDAPGLTIEQVFKKVRVGVEDTTQGRQLPWETSSLRGDFYFKNQLTAITPSIPSQPINKTPESPVKPVRPEAVKEVAQRKVSKLAHKLSIYTNPEDSQVRLLNSPVTYSAGVQLEPGDYRVEVSKEGYATKKQWINIAEDDVELQITLVPEF
jgi:hypothetical protein